MNIDGKQLHLRIFFSNILSSFQQIALPSNKLNYCLRSNNPFAVPKLLRIRSFLSYYIDF